MVKRFAVGLAALLLISGGSSMAQSDMTASSTPPAEAAPAPTTASGTADSSTASGTAAPASTAASGSGAADSATGTAGTPPDPANILVFELDNGGVIKILMRPDKAPGHVARISQLARKNFYDKTPFHRVIEHFMAQGGDPTGTGTGGSNLPDLKAEFNDLPHLRGTASMARTNDPNSANSQFFICFEPAPFLDGQYTVWGRVIEGMDAVDSINRGEPPAKPTRIARAYILADKKD